MVERADFELTKPVAVAKESINNKTSEIRDLERIMRAEVSAVEAYKQVLKKFPSYENVHDLKSTLADHEKAVEFWKTQLRSNAAPTKVSSGPWSVVVATFHTTAKLSAGSATLKSLKEGEVHMLNEYEEILRNSKVNFQSTSFIKNICLDEERKHMAILDSLIGQS